jgi:anti-anti-sigma factor
MAMIGHCPSQLHVIRLAGEIDLATWVPTRDRILSELRDSACDVALIDCGEVTLLGACGLTMIVQVQRHADADSVELVWSRFGDLPRRILEIVGFDERLTLVD